MAEKYQERNGSVLQSVTYYNGNQTKKNGSEKMECFSDDEYCL